MDILEEFDNYYFILDKETEFRRILLKDFKKIFLTQYNILINNKDILHKKCSKCGKLFPANTYFFFSGGKQGLHRYCKVCENVEKYGWGRNKNYELNIQGYHYCNKCDRVLPLNEIYFNKSSGRCNKNGFSSNCKECIGGKFGLNLLNNYIITKDSYKICTSCLLELPATKFYFFYAPHHQDKLQSICKKCKNFEYGMYRINKSIKKEGYKHCNKCKTWYPNNNYYFYNINNYYCKQCSSFISNHTKLEKYHYIKKYWFDTLEYFMDSQGFVHCAYCGEIVINPNLEHIIPESKGGKYEKNNIIPVGGIYECRCNQSKNNRSIDEFYCAGGKNNTFNKERYDYIIKFINIFTDTGDE